MILRALSVEKRREKFTCEAEAGVREGSEETINFCYKHMKDIFQLIYTVLHVRIQFVI